MDNTSSMYLSVRLNRDAKCFFPVESKDYEIRFVWIQKDVGEKRGTIRTHWNADCLLEDFSGKNHENIVN